MIGFTYQHETDSPIARSDLPEEVVDWYHRSLEAGHTNPDIVNSLGDIYLRSGRVQEAITCFSQVAEIYRAKGYVSKSVAVLKKISRLAP
ncbi:MAG TPA: tetratricopeptide repeat protein, partial [Blastocatellia bacterium]|nr:tetratricopeptide repeat protein [Blastocatellia bacterium]